ncbi:MAG: hypothetical protein ACTS5I_12460, partial [Rhodanobacter sp.]
MIRPIGIDSSPQHVFALQRNQNNMPFRKIFLVAAGVLSLACGPSRASNAAPAPPASASAPLTVQTLPPARVKATLDNYRQWLNTLGERQAVAGLATAVVIGDKV